MHACIYVHVVVSSRSFHAYDCADYNYYSRRNNLHLLSLLFNYPRYTGHDGGRTVAQKFWLLVVVNTQVRLPAGMTMHCQAFVILAFQPLSSYSSNTRTDTHTN